MAHTASRSRVRSRPRAQDVVRHKSTSCRGARMGSTTEWVRQALAELGSDATDQELKAYIRGKDPSAPEGHVSLALQKLRRKVIPAGRRQSRAAHPRPTPSQGELF